MDTMTEDESADEDEVVKEFDVYLSKSLFGNLYLLQYPVQSTKRNYGPQDRQTARIKPNNNKIEMPVALDISSPNYDQSKGEQIALNVDGNTGSIQASTTFETNVMDKQILQSTTVHSAGKKYVSAVIQNDEIHLTPISHVLQLRPSFKYMDQAEHRATQAAKAKAAAEADSSQDEAEEARAVTVRVKGAESEAVRLARERSYAAYEKRLAEEAWIQTKFHYKTENYAERERQRLFCQSARQPDEKMGQAMAAFSEMVQTPTEYLIGLVPVYEEHAVDNSAMPNNVLSLSLLKNETLGDQLKLLMKNAKILHFSHLISLLPDPPDVSIIVRSLQSFAVLVKGCWVVKSDVLFPPETLSPISGTPAESLCKSRDYVLFMFTRKEYLVRKEITSTVKIPGDDVKAMLEDIAVVRVGRGWQLRLPPDADFVRRFPEVCERQGMLWAAQGAKLAKQLNLNELIGNMGSVNIKHEVVSPPRKKKATLEDVPKKSSKTAPKRQRKTSGQISCPTRSPHIMDTKVKPEPMSPPAAMQTNNLTPHSLNSNISNPPHANLPFVNLSALPHVQSIMLTPPHGANSALASPHVNNLGILSPKINVAGVTSTVQSVANEMIKISSPEQKFYIPQMNITAAVNNNGGVTPMQQIEKHKNNISNNINDHES